MCSVQGFREILKVSQDESKNSLVLYVSGDKSPLTLVGKFMNHITLSVKFILALGMHHVSVPYHPFMR